MRQKLALGTDAGALPDHPFGYTGHRELEILVRLGMSPMQALVAATGAAAAALNQSDLGVLEPGRRASFVVLTADPLADIRNTRRIESVYPNEREVDREGIARGLRGRCVMPGNRAVYSPEVSTVMGEVQNWME
jgi:imidazolonepropionase-like amidohydrolase